MSTLMVLAPLLLASLGAVQGAPTTSAASNGAWSVGAYPSNTAGFTNPVVAPSRGGAATCISGTVAVKAASHNLYLRYGQPVNQSQATETFVQLVSDGSPFTQQLVGGYLNTSGTYDIGVSLCTPANGTTSSTVQFLTHGIGFDRNYWDFAPGYSYVDYAAAQGHTTFLYDRLGVGKSAKPDPILIIQAPFEIEIAAGLIQMLRNGSFGGEKFSRVAGVGHSFGSAITQGITVQHPTLLDAAVLTGFSINGTGQPGFLLANNFALANQNDPQRFGNLNNGFVVTPTEIATQTGFFRSPGFDPVILSQAVATRATVTFGELFTLAAVTRPAANYTGTVAVVNGDSDLPFCAGNCTYPVNKAAQVIPALYPHARNMTNSSFIVPMSGHGINLHFKATAAYEFIQNFLTKSGL